MIHSVMHTWTLHYCKETFGVKHGELQSEVDLFNQHWETVRVNTNTMGRVTISHSNSRIAEAAAQQFQHTIKRHSWWKEIYHV